MPLPTTDDSDYINFELLLEELKSLPGKLKDARKGGISAARGARISTAIGRRLAGVRAFHDNHFSLISGRLKLNSQGNRRGIVRRGGVAARKYFDALDGYYKSMGKLVVFLDLAGIPLKASEFSWQDKSLKGISANTLAAVAQWSSEKVYLTGPRLLTTAVDSLGRGAGTLGYRNLERDFTDLSRLMDNRIEISEQWISRVMSPSNARDVLSEERSVFFNLPLLAEEIANRAPSNVRDAITWDRSVVNPDNLPILFDEIAIRSHELHKSMVELIETVLD